MRPRASFVLLGLLLAACGDDGGSAADTTTSTDATGTTGTATDVTVGPTSSSGTDPASDSTTSGADSSTGEPAAECGNGEVDEGEQCDDGNEVDDDECSNACVARCGMIWNQNMPADFGARALSLDSTGNIAVLGWEFDPVRKMSSPTKRTYDVDGTLVNEQTASVAWIEYANQDSVIDNDDNTFVFADAQEPGAVDKRLRLYKFDATMAEVFDVAMPPLVFAGGVIGEPTIDVDVTPEGDAVVVAQIEVADGDDDVWVGKYSGVDGAQLWTTTYSGPLQGGFSTDSAGRVVVADDGTIFVGARVRNSFDQQPVVLLRFAADGGAAEIADAPFPDPGPNYEQDPIQFATNGAQTAIGIDVFASGPGTSGSVVGLLEGDTFAWTVQAADDLEPTKDISLGFSQPAVAVDADGNVLVALSEITDPDPTDGSIDIEVVVARYDSTGAIQCSQHWVVPEADGHRQPFRAEVLADGSLVVFGEGGSGIWIARFRQ